MSTLYRIAFSIFSTFCVIGASGQTVTHTIQQIQGELFASPLAGQIVTTTGIISANEMTSATSGVIGYFLQDGVGAWSGVFVYDNTQLPNVGDEVLITAEVAEYFDCTELINVSYFEVLSTGNEVTAEVVPTGTLGAEGEPYEGVLVTIANAECTTPDADFGEAIFNDGSGEVKTNDYMYIPEAGWTLGEVYTLTGPLHYTYEEHKIEVRSMADVQIGQSVAENSTLSLQAFPNPTSANLSVIFPEPVDVVRIYGLNGAKVAEAFDVRGVWPTDLSALSRGTYLIEAWAGEQRYSQRVLKD
jgi:hypothetical protein